MEKQTVSSSQAVRRPAAAQPRQVAPQAGAPRSTSSQNQQVRVKPNLKLWTPPVYNESLRVRIDTRTALKNHCLLNTSNGPVRDNIKILKSHLLNRTRQQGWRTIMVTSVQPGEGKTVTAINLALALAREDYQTVTLVDADLRKPAVGRYLGIESRYGLADYFTHHIPMENIMLWPGIEKMTLIAGGQPMEDSSEIIGSPRMGALVKEMKTRYEDRYLLFDFPPLLSVADTFAFFPYVDCVLLVVESGRTASRDILKAVSLIPKDKLLGLALNKTDKPEQPEYAVYSR